MHVAFLMHTYCNYYATTCLHFVALRLHTHFTFVRLVIRRSVAIRLRCRCHYGCVAFMVYVLLFCSPLHTLRLHYFTFVTVRVRTFAFTLLADLPSIGFTCCTTHRTRHTCVCVLHFIHRFVCYVDAFHSFAFAFPLSCCCVLLPRLHTLRILRTFTHYTVCRTLVVCPHWF